MDYDDDDFLDSIKSPGELTEEVRRRKQPVDPVADVKSPEELAAEVKRRVLRRIRTGQ